MNGDLEKKENFIRYLNDLAYDSLRPFFRPTKGFPIDEEFIRRNTYYGLILYYVATKTPLCKEDFEAYKEPNLSWSMAESLYDNWLDKPLSYAVESYCCMVNFLMDHSARAKTKNHYYLVPNMTAHKQEIIDVLLMPWLDGKEAVGSTRCHNL